MPRFRYILLCLSLFWLSAGAKAHHEYVVWYKSLTEPVSVDLLHLLLDESDSHQHPVTLSESLPYTQGRAFLALAQNKGVDIVTAAPNLFRESNTKAIPIPINRGLLGVRLCLVKKGNKRLEGVETLAHLMERNIVFGQGEHWPDTHVLESNGLRVVRNPVHEGLFGMLKAGRFDCFPRAITEIDVELNEYGAEHYEVVPGFAIVYKLPLLFWANTENKKLTELLHVGMLKSIFNESYYELTAKHFEGLLKKYNLNERHIIRLQNPYKSNLYSQIDEKLWHPLVREAPESNTP